MKLYELVQQIQKKYYSLICQSNFDGISQTNRIMILMAQRYSSLKQLFLSKRQLQLKYLMDKLNNDPLKLLLEILSIEGQGSPSSSTKQEHDQWDIPTQNNDYQKRQNNNEDSNLHSTTLENYFSEKIHINQEKEQNDNRKDVDNSNQSQIHNKDLFNDEDDQNTKLREERNNDNEIDKMWPSQRSKNIGSNQKRIAYEAIVETTSKNGIKCLDSHFKTSKKLLDKILCGQVKMPTNPTLQNLAKECLWANHKNIFEFLLRNPSKQEYCSNKEHLPSESKNFVSDQDKRCAEEGKRIELTAEEFKLIQIIPSKNYMLKILTDEQDEQSIKISKEFKNYLTISKNQYYTSKISKFKSSFIECLKYQHNRVSIKVLQQMKNNYDKYNDCEEFKKFMFRLHNCAQKNDPLQEDKKRIYLFSNAKELQNLEFQLSKSIDQFNKTSLNSRFNKRKTKLNINCQSSKKIKDE